MTETSDSARLKPETYTSPRRRHRRRCCAACVCCSVVILLLGIVVLVLALTVFKVKDPSTTLVSTRVEGISPSFTLPAIKVEINVTLNLDLLVYNPNYASFAHAPGKTQLYYRGNQVGDADVAPGRIPSRGSEHVYSTLTVEADRFASDLGTLLGDVVAGKVGLDASTRIPGRITFLGFIKHHAVAFSDCHVVIGFPGLKVQDQQCTQSTKL